VAFIAEEASCYEAVKDIYGLIGIAASACARTN
jgi:hypothetical protein